ncbi:Hsp20/alpha crystallin family protein [Balneolaceae bacterium YR4-1]|uniref:Hsp20/alpha crystallin family protein n=1 Tax=Halalkalibaculum roseum TaxID=2709311 RepID=A0A6M1SWN7_9BACT|nr:Hsp20/alpha crystallin family protein [Halalkalibaculum roseum]NGP76578.1 Hsp20/alpha crystallin family protein [Halalkalibaculum roseum]
MKTLTKYSDMSPLEAIKRDMDLIFDDISPFSRIRRGNGGFGMELWAPDTDMSETENAYILTMDLPGLKKDDVDVSFTDNRLTISGERSRETKEEDKDFIRKERYLGKFSRAFTMPADVVEDKIKATFKNGVLTVDIPKAEVKKPKKVSID